MNLETFVKESGLELLAFLICIYYGIRLLILHDISIIRGKNKPPVKDEKAYMKVSGSLILYLAVVFLLMAFLMYVSVYAALAEICVGIIVFGILWRSMDKKYGA